MPLIASSIKYCEPQRTQSSQSLCVFCDLCGKRITLFRCRVYKSRAVRTGRHTTPRAGAARVLCVPTAGRAVSPARPIPHTVMEPWLRYLSDTFPTSFPCPAQSVSVSSVVESWGNGEGEFLTTEHTETPFGRHRRRPGKDVLRTLRSRFRHIISDLRDLGFVGFHGGTFRSEIPLKNVKRDAL